MNNEDSQLSGSGLDAMLARWSNNNVLSFEEALAIRRFAVEEGKRRGHDFSPKWWIDCLSVGLKQSTRYGNVKLFVGPRRGRLAETR